MNSAVHARGPRMTGVLCLMLSAWALPGWCQLDDDRDLVRDLGEHRDVAELRIQSVLPPVAMRRLSTTLRSSSTSATVDRKQDQLALTVNWQLAPESRWTLRASTNGLTSRRPEGQPSVGGWTDTELLAIYGVDPETSVIARVTVPAHGALGSSELEQALRVIHSRKRGRHTWTGLLTASHQAQSQAGVSAQSQAIYLEWKRTSDTKASWTLSFSTSHRKGKPNPRTWSLAYGLPVALGGALAAKSWTLSLALSRWQAGVATETTSTVSLSRPWDL